ncbi:hypothetical protein [Pedobacter immunditicola]|uniref:hypothetical protein n=1 Tax=Pedobacter immunditicola TaxID=3133440 RepID=UPI0030A3D5D7
MKTILPGIILVVLLCTRVTAQSLQQQSQLRLVQTTTKSFPSEIKAYFPAEFISMGNGKSANAVIVKIDRDDKNRALTIQKELKRSWGLEFPIVDWEMAKTTNGNLILYGAVNDNTPLRQLNANSILGNNTLGYELRTIPNALDWKRDVLYIGAHNDQDLKEGLSVLTAKVKTPDRIPYLVACKGWDKPVDKAALTNMVNIVKQHYKNNGSYVLTQTVISEMLKQTADLYKMTGNDVYAKTFAEMQNLMFQNFGKTLNGRTETAPSFTFYLYPQFIYTIENSKAFTANDRLKSAEFIRRIVEEMMVHWEMKIPLDLYHASKQDYLTNHACFASRSVSSSARYLLSRYDYAPAKFWTAVADNAFAGVAPNPFSPEDAAGYQYLVYQIFIDYALASGKYDLNFFNNQNFVSYLNFAKFQLNHLGYTAGFGDAYPIGHNSAYPILKQSLNILGDKESEYIIDLIESRSQHLIANRKTEKVSVMPPGKHTFGLNYQAVVPFKLEQYGVAGLYEKPTLDKAVFRSGWDKHADFMSITGINGDGYNHSHFDANGISQYISGDRLWLFEGDYIKKFPNDHNAIVVSKDGKLTDQSRSLKVRRKSSLSQVLAAVNTTERTASLISLLLEEYNGLNWTRNINYAAKNGFWVIDELDILQDGRYIAEANWRSTGTMVPQGQSVKFTQKKSDDKQVANHFFITEGNGAAQVTKSVWDAGHGRKDGNLSGYSYSDRSTRYVIQRINGDYKKGDKQLFVNFMQAVPGSSPKAPVVRKLSPTAFLAESIGVFRLAVINHYTGENIDIEADACFVGPEGIVARGAKRIKIGNINWKSAIKKDIALDLPGDFNQVEVNKFLAKTISEAETLKPKPFADLPVKEVKIASSNNYKAPISVTASGDDRFAVGSKDGLLSITDMEGKLVASYQFPRAVSAITSVKTPSGLCWAVATAGSGDGKVYYLNELAEVIWEQTIPVYQKRNGTVTTLFTANIGRLNGPAIIAGSDSWHYYAFSVGGEQLWKQTIFHGATVGAAGDMDGNGVDDIAAGTEYYYHSIIQNGKVMPHKVTSPWDYAVAVTDLNNDGLKEAVFGRGDGFIYVQGVDKNPVKQWRLNVGGKPTSIVALTGQTAKIAVANELGNIVFVDGGGQVTDSLNLPAGLTDLKLWKNQLLALCMDGNIYNVDFKGKVLAKFPYIRDSSSTFEPKITVSDKVALVFSGNKTFTIK